MLASEQTKLLQAESCSVCHTPFHRYYILRPDDYRMELQLFPFSLERGDPCLLFCPLYCCAWGATELMVLIHLPDAASPPGRRSLLGSDLMDDLSSSTVCDPQDSEGIIRSRCCHTCRLYTNVKGIQKKGSSLGYRYGTLVSPPFSI